MLTDAKARKINASDKPLSDSLTRGLYLFPSSTPGIGKWIMRFVSPITGKRRDMGLGRYPEVSIREARITAQDARRLLERGADPLEARRMQQEERQHALAMPCFAEAARIVHAEISLGFKNAKHAAQWLNTLEQYVVPEIGATPVADLRAGDFARCLKPIWISKPETASRVRQRCDTVMNWCAAQGYIVASPVGVVDKLLARQPGKRERIEHHAALPWRDVPNFIAGVLQSGARTQSKAVLTLLILTAARSGEIRGMRWDEIDLEKAIWTVPAERMKAKVAHRVPLSSPALEMLERLHQATDGSGLVFSSRKGTPLRDMVLTKLLRQHRVKSDTPGRLATAHGFRSSFRDWASESGYPRDVAERALAHTIKSSTEAAYHRTDLLERRRVMMQAWAEHVVKDRNADQ